MAVESVHVTTRDDRASQGRAEVIRHGQGRRVGVALAVALGGAVLGAASIVIPVVHFVSTWFIPLLALGIAFHLYRQAIVVRRVDAICPACGEQVVIDGAPWEDPLWLRCSACRAPLRVDLDEGA